MNPGCFYVLQHDLLTKRDLKIILVWFDFYYGKDFNQASCSYLNSQHFTC
jgi:hypothetical protein